MRQDNMPSTAKGKRLEADALRRNAQRAMDDARQLDASADAQDLDERILADVRASNDPSAGLYGDGYPDGFDEQYDIGGEA